jgi:hypothetical protein
MSAWLVAQVTRSAPHTSSSPLPRSGASGNGALVTATMMLMR